MSSIAKELSVTVGTLTIAMNSLVKKGYVKRERGEEDRRVVYISLSDKGKKAFIDVYKRQVHQKGRTDLRTPETGDTGRPELAVTGLFVGFLGLWYLHIKKEREERNNEHEDEK